MSKNIILLSLGLGSLLAAGLLRGTAEPLPVPQDQQYLENVRLAQIPTDAESLNANIDPLNESGDGTAMPAAAPKDSANSENAIEDPEKSKLDAGVESSPEPTSEASPEASSEPSVAPTPKASSPEELHRLAIVVDTHVETPLLMSENNKVRLRSNQGQVSLEKLRQGGTDVVFFSIYVNPYRYQKIAKSQADFIIKTLKNEIEANQDWIELATSYADIQRIVKSGKIAGLMGMEGADPIGESLDNINYFYKQGVRYIGPTWSTHTLMADSSGQPKPRWNGLSKFGKMAITRMNDLGMLIDVSHLSDASFNDVLKLSSAPVIASHSGVDGILVHSRNLSNEMLKLLSLNGGVVGIVFYPPHLSKDGKADVGTVIDHIEYAMKVAGPDHVGLGSDFDGLDRPPPVGLKDASDFPAITQELKKRGHSDEDVYKILGGNFMRVFEQVLK